MTTYPDSGPARNRFVLDHRGPVAVHDPWQAQGLAVEDEALPDGSLARTAVLFLTGRECPWRCVMCDLWRFTTVADTPLGAIPAQVAWARQTLVDQGEAVTQFKLYNASSFFDPKAVPFEDYEATARHLPRTRRVIVESHPALTGPAVERFRRALEDCTPEGGAPPALEVALGLETAHPAALASLNKRMTVQDFRQAAAGLLARAVSVRAFLLIHPPFIPADEQEMWLLRSIDEAFAAGASVVSLIPTRAGNGALEALTTERAFDPPSLSHVERALEAGLARAVGRGRLFLDLWDLDRTLHCAACIRLRTTRLQVMNHEQRVLPSIRCPTCAGGRA